MNKAVIYVRIMNEGIDVWKPVKSLRLLGDCYEIIEEQCPDEELEFKKGQHVKCTEKELGGEKRFIAIESCEK